MAQAAVQLGSGGAGPQALRHRPRWGWLRGLRSAKIVVGLVIIGIFLLVAIVGPILDQTDPSAVSAAVLEGPSAAHLFGTTQTGQDIFAQVVAGTQVSMLVGISAAAVATALSIIVGLCAGFLGGVTDEVLSVLSNIFLVIPSLPLVVILAGYLSSRGTLSVTVVIAVTGWAWGARVLRAQTLSIRKRDFVEAARASGEGSVRIIFAEIMPNQLAIIAAGFLGTVTFAILTQASLAFLGLSSVSQWSWGTVLYWAQVDNALLTGAWWWFVPPGLCIALVGMGLALLNFGVDEFINPRLRAAGLSKKGMRRAGLPRQPKLGLTPVVRNHAARATAAAGAAGPAKVAR